MSTTINKARIETIDNEIQEKIEYRIEMPRHYLAQIELFSDQEWEMLKKANNSNNIPLMLDTLKMIIEKFEGEKHND